MSAGERRPFGWIQWGMAERGPSTVEQVLQQSEGQSRFLTPRDKAGAWRTYFGEAAPRVPEPYWLYTEDEHTQLVLGFPLRISTAWESFCRDLGHLVEGEALYRAALAIGEATNKPALVEQRVAVAQRLAEMLENAMLHDHSRRFPEVLWLAVSREMATAVRTSVRSAFARAPGLVPKVVEEIRYTVAQRLTDLSHRAEQDALARLQTWSAADSRLAITSFGRVLRADLLPFAETHVGAELKELGAYLQGHLKVDPARFSKLLAATAAQLDNLRHRDPSFDRTLALLDEEAAALPSERLFFSPAVLDLLAVWGHPDVPHLSTDMIRLLKDLSARIKRFEVIACLRNRLFPVSPRGSRAVTKVHGQLVRLSAFTRPLDFTIPGVVDSAVRRYGLLYDLVEFTQLLEDLRRRGHSAEESGLRFMVRFQREIEEIRARHRLKFEKFLGDGAFYSARSARSVFLAAADLRILYERLRHEGFPFDRGLRLAVNVGSYHLLSMATDPNERPHFEFFGHGLTELARLTSGKTTREVEDITDFLIANGYEVQRILEFLEPVRHGSRYPDHVKQRPYAAFLAENNELVNTGGVVTEAFLRDLSSEGVGLVARGERFGLDWLLVPCDRERLDGPWVGLRALGTARLKGLDPTLVAEMVVFDEPPEGMLPLGEDVPLLHSLQELGGKQETELESLVPTDDAALVPHLCVVSALEHEDARDWYIGQYVEEIDALAHSFRVPLSPVDLQDGEPFEAWLLRRRGELAMLYQGLRRDSQGSTVPLESLRSRDGYLTCLLATPLRSPR